MATLKEIVEYSKQNPDSDYARQAFERIQSGAWDEKAKEEGYDLSWAGRPSIQPIKPERGIFDDIGDRMKDLPGDFLDVGKDITESFQRKTQRLGADVARRREGGVTPEEVASTALQLGGSTLTTLTDSIFSAALGGIKATLTQEQEDYIANQIRGGAEKIANTDAVKNLVAGWNEFEKQDPETASNLRTAADFAQVLLDVTGLKAGGAVTKKTVEQAADVIAKATPVVEKGMKTGGELLEGAISKTDEVLKAERASRITKNKLAVDEAVGKIIQGKTGDIEKAKRALLDIDTTGVKTYSELNERIGDGVETLSRKLDEFLSTIDEQVGPVKPEELVTTTKVGAQTVTQNFVGDALKQLEELYTVIKDAPSAARIQNLAQKLSVSGLTRKELNDLAREYGREFSSKAFSKATGDPLTSVNAQAFENTRKGIKEAVRATIKGKTAKEIDGRISDLLETQRLTQKMEEKVNALWQRVQKRGLGEKLVRMAADVFDVATAGSLKGFVGRLLPSNVGLKTMNSIDIENMLQKNLQRIADIEKIKDDETFVKMLDTLIRGLNPKNVPKAAGAATPNLPRINSVLEEAFGARGQGITIDIYGNKPTSGFVFAPRKDTELVIPASQFTQKDIAKYVEKYYDELTKPGNHVGLWPDGDNIYLDVSKVVDNEQEALKLAQESQQLAIYDIRAGQAKYLDEYEQTNGLFEYRGKKQGADNQGVDGVGTKGGDSEVIDIGDSPTNQLTQKQIDTIKALSPQQVSAYLDFKTGAKQAYPEFENLYNKVAEGLDLPKTEYGPSLKGDARAIEKAVDDYGSDFTRIKDMLRGQYTVNSATQFEQLLQKITKEFPAGATYKNNILNPMDTGYRDIKVNVKMSNGITAEFQIMFPEMETTKFKLHGEYEKARPIISKKARGEKTTAQEENDLASANKAMEKAYTQTWKEVSKKYNIKDGFGNRLESILQNLK